MNNPLHGKRILLGITGSIACYKAADLASKLTQSGAQVDVILTHSATQFVTPLTFQSVTGQQVYIDNDLWGSEGHILHIGLVQSADLLVIAPATANTIAKLTSGIADNLLTITAMAATCPVVIAPAMDGGIYAHPATQNNIEILLQRGATIIGPAEGHLASGMVGLGRMVEPEELLGHIRLAAAKNGPLQGRKVVVSAGGTQETIDPVRSITNRSSGKQGYALAQAALDLGAQVTLISAPTCLEPPMGAKMEKALTTQEMLVKVLDAVREADVLIMAAAVADFKPAHSASHKIKKESGVPEMTLEPTPDILEEVAKLKEITNHPHITVGFAAESEDLINNAQVKLRRKKLDIIVANDISAEDAGFSVETNRVTVLYSNGNSESLPLLSKHEVAQVVLDQVVTLLEPEIE
jgi:phosphopantothenoylcysteine decarboxylase/phosphopantothenate--cysteine ligase